MKKNRQIQLLTLIMWLINFVVNTPSWAQQPAPSSLPAYEGELKDPTRVELDGEFKKRTEQQVLRLQEYIQIISDKSQPIEKREIAIKEVIKLFEPGATIQVSTGKKGGQIVTRPIGEYFRRLRDLSYPQVEITFYDATYVGDYRKGPDGGFYNTATFSQEFKGKNEKGEIIHQDKTQKDVDISLKNMTNEDFYKQNSWIIKFGNIKVTETKKQVKPIN